MTRRTKRRISIRVELSLVFAASIILVASSLIFINYVQSRKYLLHFAEREMLLASEAVSEGLKRYLGPVTTATGLLANAELIDATAATSAERFFRLSEPLLDRHPQIFTIYLGFPDGSFARTGRGNVELWGRLGLPPAVAPERIRAVLPRRPADGPRAGGDWYYRDAGEASWTRAVTADYELDPRERPWYQLAASADGMQWTSVYAWAGGSVGITGAQAVSDAGLRARGVVGVDVRLSDLATFLKSVTFSDNGHIFIAQRDGRLIAHSGFASQRTGDGLSAEAPPLNVTDPAFRAKYGLDLRLFEAAKPNGKLLVFRHDGRKIVGLAAPVGGIEGLDAVLYVAVPMLDLVGFAIRANLVGLAASIVLLACMLILSLRVAGGISRPIELLASLARDVQERGFVATVKHPGSVIREIDDAGGAFNAMIEGLREQETIRALFGRYVPEKIAAQLIRQGGALEPVTARCTVLYADVEGFSSIAERLPAATVVEMLNEYFTAATAIIEHRNGVIMQFQGDAILATYNVPVEDPAHARNAVASAIALQREVASRAFAGQSLRIRVGISTGEIVGANVGAEGRLGYTVHGDVVNLAARLEQMNKEFGTGILVSDATKSACPGLDFEPLGELSVRGKSRSVRVYSIAAEPDTRPPEA